MEFSDGFSDLHTAVYQNILNGDGYGVKDVRKAIEIIHEVRAQSPIGIKGFYHPFAKKELRQHPFKKK